MNIHNLIYKCFGISLYTIRLSIIFLIYPKKTHTNLCIILYKKVKYSNIMGKYNHILLNLILNGKIKSTNEILKALEKKTKKTINWHNLYRILMELFINGKIEKVKTKAGFFWKKK